MRHSEVKRLVEEGRKRIGEGSIHEENAGFRLVPS